jgi:hypothetical protein
MQIPTASLRHGTHNIFRLQHTLFSKKLHSTTVPVCPNGHWCVLAAAVHTRRLCAYLAALPYVLNSDSVRLQVSDDGPLRMTHKSHTKHPHKQQLTLSCAAATSQPAVFIIMWHTDSLYTLHCTVRTPARVYQQASAGTIPLASCALSPHLMQLKATGIVCSSWVRPDNMHLLMQQTAAGSCRCFGTLLLLACALQSAVRSG